MLSEKSNNFNQTKFGSELNKFSKVQSCNLPNLTMYMKSHTARILFEKMYERLIEDGYKQFDQNTKLLICRNLAKCLVDDKFENLLGKIIMKCIDSDASSDKKPSKIEVDDEDIEKPPGKFTSYNKI
jgi:hypothetical protein